MLFAIFSDIHGNREALDACVEQAHAKGAEQFIFLGDLVGYGADPGYIVDTVTQFRDEGAVVIKGNHDEAIAVGTQGMNSYARDALDWTRDQLTVAQKAFLESLPLAAVLGDALFVHAEAAKPAGWTYVTSPLDADRSMRATDKRLTVCGHVHRPQLYHKMPQKLPVCFIPNSGLPIPLARSQQWLAVVGSVGQPRDEIPSAAFTLYDSEKPALSFMRAPYDIERAARKIKEAGLPQILSARLFIDASVRENTVVDGFQVWERLHVGGMATLWRVTRDDAATPIVMKVPTSQTSDDPAAIVGFEMEQMILPLLSGQHVPAFVASGDFDGQPYLVMEYVAGESLLPRFDAAPLPIEDVVAIGMRTAEALNDLHRQHVIHLDIKPSNVMMRASGEAVLIDFGLSRHERMPDLLAEELRLPIGTGPYISPEQIGGDRTDPRSDIFSLGVLLYHLITRQRPFGYPRSHRALRRRLWRDPVPPRAITPACPAWLQEVVLRCLEPAAADRYPTAAQLAFDLKNPDGIAPSARGERLEQDGRFQAFKRWYETGAPKRRAATRSRGASRSRLS